MKVGMESSGQSAYHHEAAKQGMGQGKREHGCSVRQANPLQGTADQVRDSFKRSRDVQAINTQENPVRIKWPNCKIFTEVSKSAY